MYCLAVPLFSLYQRSLYSIVVPRDAPNSGTEFLNGVEIILIKHMMKNDRKDARAVQRVQSLGRRILCKCLGLS